MIETFKDRTTGEIFQNQRSLMTQMPRLNIRRNEARTIIVQTMKTIQQNTTSTLIACTVTALPTTKSRKQSNTIC